MSDEFDLQFEIEDGDFGLKSVTITALQMQGEIDLAMEWPRIKKLLTRDWEAEETND